MTVPIDIQNVQFKAASQGDVMTGLIGWISCTLNARLQLDGIALHRTLDGRRTLSFPARRDGSGRQHFFVRPLDTATREEIEAQIFAALGIEESPA